MSFLLPVLLAVAGIIIQGAFICVEHKEKWVAAAVLKGCASLMFVLIGFIGASRIAPEMALEVSFGHKLAAGLLFGLIGDVLLNLRFVFQKIGQKVFLAGILMFLIGHIIYLVALFPFANHILICVIAGAVIAAGLLTYIYTTMDVKLAFKIFGVFYLGAVIIMTAVAIGIAIGTPCPRSIIYAVGAVLFTASDIVLIFNTFSGVTRFSMRITNLSLYYIGQLLIAGCLYFI